MADDKTAAQTEAESRWTPDSEWDGLSVTERVAVTKAAHRAAFVAGATWQAEQVAVRRVAPDRETVERGLHVAMMGTTDGGFLADDDEIPVGEMFRLALEYLDGLLASGVLGVPADQRTADRETIARALFEGPGPHSAEKWDDLHHDATREHYLSRSDAVLAVLVPADQVRAEALREAHSIISKRKGTYEAGIDLMERVAELEAEATRG